MTYKGYDKITNYYNSDYSMLNKNAYVGGDAYNYIINGTYAAAYFVLAWYLCEVQGDSVNTSFFRLAVYDFDNSQCCCTSANTLPLIIMNHCCFPPGT